MKEKRTCHEPGSVLGSLCVSLQYSEASSGFCRLFTDNKQTLKEVTLQVTSRDRELEFEVFQL